MPPETNGWGEYSKLVLQKLKDHEGLLKDISETLVLIRVEIAMLKVKSTLWGGAAGAIPVLIFFLVNYMKAG